jgi:hypothetical protein
MGMKKIINTTLVAAGAIVGSLLGSAPAHADPATCGSTYQPPSVNPDCYFLFVVNQNAFPVAKGQEGAMIAQGKHACADMSAHTAAHPVLDWALRFQAQHPEMAPSPGLIGQANPRLATFGSIAAEAYCPWVYH